VNNKKVTGRASNDYHSTRPSGFKKGQQLKLIYLNCFPDWHVPQHELLEIETPSGARDKLFKSFVFVFLAYFLYKFINQWYYS
jgi:hypothetical protein